MVVGIDIGSEEHYARAFDNRGRELSAKPFSFHNDEEGFASLITWMEELKQKASTVSVLRQEANSVVNITENEPVVGRNIVR